MTHRDRQRRLFREALDLGVALAGADPRDFTSDAWGDGWGWGAWPVPPRYFQHQKKGELLPAYTSEAALRTLRDRSRVICAENEFALCALANRRNNVVGEGIKYRAVSDDAGLARAVQSVIDKWTDLVDLASVESEAMVRLDRDGEFILRTFEQSSGFLALRFQEPEHLRSPVGDGSTEYSYGVQTLPHDVGTKVGYWLLDDVPSAKPNFVPADEVLHVTLNGDSNAKRGLPTFYPVEGLLRYAEDVLTSMAVQTKTQSKIAYIRRLNGVTAEGAEELRQSLTVATATDYRSPGGVRNVESLPPGSVLTASGNIDYEFPGIKVGASDGVAVLQAILRAVAARLVMPEWMLTVDASNANYSSSLIAEAPSTRQFLWLQRLFRQAFGESRRPGCPSLLWRQLGVCVRRGVLPPSVYRAVTVHAEAPSLVVRDKGQEAQVNKIYVQDLKIKSPETAAQEQGWDYAEEQGKIRKSANDPAGQASQQQQPFGAPGQGGGLERPPATGIRGNPASEGGSEGADPFGIDARLLESLAEAGFTGTIRDTKGREYHYVNGKRVARPPDAPAAPRRHSVDEVHEHVSKLLAGGEPITPQHLREVGNMLLTMSVADAHAVKKKLGLRASGDKETLARKIAERAFASANVTPKNPPAEPPATDSATAKPPKQPAGIRVEWYGDAQAAEKVKATARKVFGRDLTPEEWGAAACAPPGAKVTVGANAVSVVFFFDHEGVSAQREVYRGGDGIVCHNHHFEIAPKSKHRGTGANLFLDQVRQLKSLGVVRVSTEAAGSGEGMKGWEDRGKQGEPPLNGYYTWPRLGYSGEIRPGPYARLSPELKEALGDSRDVRTILDRPGGAEAWKAGGVPLKCTFDLRDGSKNLELLDTYIRERNAKTK